MGNVKAVNRTVKQPYRVKPYGGEGWECWECSPIDHGPQRLQLVDGPVPGGRDGCVPCSVAHTWHALVSLVAKHDERMDKVAPIPIWAVATGVEKLLAKLCLV